MIRVVLINLFLLLLPFIIYFGYVYLLKEQTGDATPIRTAPILVLFAIGVMLMMGAIAYFIQFSSGKPGQTYRPPVIEDGVIRPGHLE